MIALRSCFFGWQFGLDHFGSSSWVDGRGQFLLAGAVARSISVRTAGIGELEHYQVLPGVPSASGGCLQRHR
jgi:hypothetical protein